MTDMTPTEYGDVVTMFHSMPKTREVISDKLEQQYFLQAMAEFQLNIKALAYDPVTEMFDEALPFQVIYTLALLMYVAYLRQELSRTLRLNGISGKDITLTGVPASKQYTSAELQAELTKTQQLLYKQMQHAYL